MVLQISPYSETSRVVVWFTSGFGKINTLVKGSQRAKSSFLGQYDLFYTCEILFYARHKTDLHILKECAPLKSRERFRSDWKAAVLASYLTELCRKAIPQNTKEPSLYRLLDSSLDELEKRGAKKSSLFWTELKLLDELGFQPNLRQCTSCGKAMKGSEKVCYFVFSEGGLRCAACPRKPQAEEEQLAPDVLAPLLGWQKALTPQMAHRTRASHAQTIRIQSVLGSFLSYHLELPLKSRAIALDVLDQS